MIMWYIFQAWVGLGLLAYQALMALFLGDFWHLPRPLRKYRYSAEETLKLVPGMLYLCVVTGPVGFGLIVYLFISGRFFRFLVGPPPFSDDRLWDWEAVERWTAGRNAGEMLHGVAGRAKHRLHVLVGCACCRLIWDRLTDDRCRRAVEAAAAAAERPDLEVRTSEGIDEAVAEANAAWGWRRLCAAAACQECLTGRSERVAYYVEVLEPRLADTLVAVVRCVVGDPFAPPQPRSFPAEVVELARACDAGEPLHGVLADALDELGEEAAAAHCRTPVHVKGCHVVEWVLGRR